jgi:hypothetical protein
MIHRHSISILKEEYLHQLKNNIEDKQDNSLLNKIKYLMLNLINNNKKNKTLENQQEELH